jgi:antitoxin VapB
MQTKAFKSGNSLAVRIPKDLAIFEPSQDVIIERKGDTLVLRAAERKSLADVMDIFAQFGPDFMKDGRYPQEQDERDWEGIGAGGFSIQEPRPTYLAKTVPAKEVAAIKKKKPVSKVAQRK